MQAYRGALGELREDMQVSPFASWTLEQLQVPLSLSSHGWNLPLETLDCVHRVVEHSMHTWRYVLLLHCCFRLLLSYYFFCCLCYCSLDIERLRSSSTFCFCAAGMFRSNDVRLMLLVQCETQEFGNALSGKPQQPERSRCWF